MTRLCSLLAPLSLVLLLGLAAPPARAQVAESPGPVGGAPATLPELKLPNLNELRLQVPRPVQALSSALGYGRQRLALVVGIGKLGSRLAIDSAPRDVQAVAAALRSGGYIVMLREDIGASDLRRALDEFRTRLQPGGVGFAYFTGLGAQVDGQNLLLPRDVALDGPAGGLAARLKSGAVPLQEVVDALQGTADSPRMLVVDAAYRNPALAALPKPGLADQKLPPGMMALFGHALGSVQEVPAVAPLPEPLPDDPREVAASRFARVLVGAIGTPRLSGPDVLRGTAKSIVDATLGLESPWVSGDTESREDFAETTLLEGILPRTPEDFAREAGKQILSAGLRSGATRGGEQTVAQVLEQSATPAQAMASPSQAAPAEAAARPPGPSTPPRLPSLPSGPSALGTAVGTAGTVANAVATAAGVAGTAASVAGAAAGVAGMAASAQVAQTSAAVSAATAAAGTVATGVGNAVALVSRLGTGSPAEQPARQVAQQLASAAPSPAAVAAPAAGPGINSQATASGARALAEAQPAAPAAADMAPAAAPAQGAAPLQAAAAAASPAAAATTAAQVAPELLQAASPAAARPRASAGSQVPPPDGRTAPTAEGGERPVYLPRTNNFGYAEGDTYTYQVVDTWKDQVIGTFTQSIEEVLGDGQLLANGHQLELDPQGRIKMQRRPDGSFSQFEPSQDLWWSRPKVGESRSVKFTESVIRANGRGVEIEYKGSSSVGRLKKIETPAGEFDALPIETSGWFYETLPNGSLSSGQFSRTVWYSPKLGHPVAIDIEDADRLGKLLKRERVELMHAQQVRGTP